MVDEYVAKDIQDVLVGDSLHFQVSYEQPNGEMMHHIFPHSLVHDKILEMGMDPQDDTAQDLAMDWILHDPWHTAGDIKPAPQVRGLAVVEKSPRGASEDQVEGAKSRVYLNLEDLHAVKDRMRAAVAVELNQRKEE